MTVKHLLIATPTMAGIMKSHTATTLITLMRQLTIYGISVEYMNIDSSDIVYARNLFAKMVVNSKTLDSVLFVDSDMQFDSSLVVKLIEFGADVVATAYPKRALDMNRAMRAMAGVEAFTQEAKARALASSYEFTVLPAWDSKRVDRIQLVRGFSKMAAAGMGCTLIRRQALQTMIDEGVAEPRKDIFDGVEENSWGFFDCLKVGEVTLSEDFSFCYRWTKLLGRDLWVCVDQPITHLGEFAHQARYIDRFGRIVPRAATTARDSTDNEIEGARQVSPPPPAEDIEIEV